MNLADDKAVEVVENPLESEDELRRGIGFELKDIEVSFGGIKALVEINFQLAPGERVGIIGNNGAGKSTLCDVITGLKRPSSGTFLLENKNVTNKSAIWRAKKGMRRVFQHPVYYEDLSLVENVMIGSPQSKGDGIIASFFIPRLFYKEQKETALRIMEFCSIEETQYQLSKQLPYGTKKRIELARALMGNPRVLILDEPAASMDDSERANYCQVVLDYAQTFSTTLLVVEHDVEIIKTLCDRVIAIDAGKIIADGDVTSVLRNDKVKELYLMGKV